MAKNPNESSWEEAAWGLACGAFYGAASPLSSQPCVRVPNVVKAEYWCRKSMDEASWYADTLTIAFLMECEGLTRSKRRCRHRYEEKKFLEQSE